MCIYIYTYQSCEVHKGLKNSLAELRVDQLHPVQLLANLKELRNLQSKIYKIYKQQKMEHTKLCYFSKRYVYS